MEIKEIPIVKSEQEESGNICGIPIRNIWLLLLYASDLFRQLDHAKVAVEELPDDIRDFIAKLLADVVERRLRRNLTFGYQPRKAVLGRVRGRIDVLTTERKQLLARGVIACRFEDLTVNTPRNRYVRTALETIAGIVSSSELAHRCRVLASSLKRLGVSGESPSRTEVSTDCIGFHDKDDQLMVAAAKLVLERTLPTEDVGSETVRIPDREIEWLRTLYEKAIGGFYKVVLPPHGWTVDTGTYINWNTEEISSRIKELLPTMQTDIILKHESTDRRIVIDTKFNSVITSGRFGKETFRSGYMYQIYAYLRSQDGTGNSLADRAEGLLLHPSIGGEMINEWAKIQGHVIRFATVNLAASTNDIRARLIELVQ